MIQQYVSIRYIAIHVVWEVQILGSSLSNALSNFHGIVATGGAKPC